MKLKKSHADLVYKQLLKGPRNVSKIIQFYKNELNSIIQLEILIRQCVNDQAYEFNYGLMQKESNNIRTHKLQLVKNKFGFFDFKAKHYFNQFLKEQ